MTYIDETAIVSPEAVIGPDVKIWKYSYVRENCTIKRGTQIGSFVYIDPEVIIGSFSVVQNHVSIFKGVTINNRCFIGPGVMFTNDLHPKANNKNWELLETIVEDDVSIGANATILPGITIGMAAMIGAGAVVTKDVPAGRTVVGVW